MTKNINCINLSLLEYEVDYRIHKFESYTLELDTVIKSSGKKIYLLDVDFDNGYGLDLALKIREYDYDSIIIMVSSLDDYQNDLYYTRLMILDLICMSDEYEKRLVDDIKLAVSIIDKCRVFTFKYNRVIYRIPLSKITYIEKEPEIKRCIIHTINNKYYITASINLILPQLDENFCRTHQSCIVNLNNIKRIDLGNNMIVFKNGDTTDMLTGKMKKVVKKYIGVS